MLVLLFRRPSSASRHRQWDRWSEPQWSQGPVPPGRTLRQDSYLRSKSKASAEAARVRPQDKPRYLRGSKSVRWLPRKMEDSPSATANSFGPEYRQRAPQSLREPPSSFLLLLHFSPLLNAVRLPPFARPDRDWAAEAYGSCPLQPYRAASWSWDRICRRPPGGALDRT